MYKKMECKADEKFKPQQPHGRPHHLIRRCPGRELRASVKVKNVGSREGKEVVQLYVGEHNPLLDRPVATAARIGMSRAEAAEWEMKFESA